MGNPHAVLFVDDAEAIDLAHIGPQLEHHPLFPDRANISFVTKVGQTSFACAYGNVVAALPLPVGLGHVLLGLR
jgi:diaminopimelate epimerase